MIIIAVGFGAIAAFAFVYRIADLARGDGTCRIGLPYRVTIPLLAYDVLVSAPEEQSAEVSEMG